jgi:hypothetical protein
MAADEPNLPVKAEVPAAAEPIFTFAEFFERVPPSRTVTVSDVAVQRMDGPLRRRRHQHGFLYA